MTYAQMISTLKDIYPHQYPDNIILMWTKELDNEIIDYLDTNFRWAEYDYRDENDTIDTTEPLIIDEPSIYIEYLYYKVCLANNEFEHANNHAVLFNSYFDAWKARYMHMQRDNTLIPKYIRGL